MIVAMLHGAKNVKSFSIPIKFDIIRNNYDIHKIMINCAQILFLLPQLAMIDKEKIVFFLPGN